MDGFGYGVPSLKMLYPDLVDYDVHVSIWHMVNLDHISCLLGT